MEKITIHAKEFLSVAQLHIFENISFKPSLTVIEAAAGAGKTRTLSYLVLKALMDESVRNVFILTATRTAKDEAFARVTKLHSDLGFDRDGQCPYLPARNVRTIHSICLGAARDEAAEENAAGVDVVSPSRISEILVDILEDIKKNGVNDDDSQQHDVIQFEDTTSEEIATLLKNMRSERMNSCIDVVDDSFGPIARQAMQELELRLDFDNETSMKLMDFDKMTEEFRASGKSIVRPGDVLFVDEGQDLTLCQLGIVMNTLRSGGCVVILGDDSQGIFQFSGACDQTIRELKERARSAGIDVKRFSLMQNWRSTHSIVEASEQLLPFTDRSSRLGVQGNGYVGDPVEVAVFKSEDEEAHGVAERVVDLVASGTVACEDVVMLRHKNWSWSDGIVQDIRIIAKERGVDVNMAILGSDGGDSLEGKFLAVLQVSIDMERFCDPISEGMALIKTFLKSMRCKGFNQKLGFRAVETVFNRHMSQDPTAIFSRYREELLEEFRVEEKKDEAEQAEKDAKKCVNAKRKRVSTVSGQKEQNFKTLIMTAGRTITQIRERVRGIEAGRKTLEPVVVSSSMEFFARDRSKPVEATYPTLEHSLGGLAWLILRDVVKHDYSERDGFSIQNIVSYFDVPYDVADMADVADELADPVSKLSAKIHDKSTDGKLVFSTIHKFKGREKDVAFVCNLTSPFSNPDWPRRATLSHEHTESCKNKSGVKTECCIPFKLGMQRLKNAQISEKLRLYYVGASRAKKRLFLSGSYSRNGEVFAPLLQLAPTATKCWSKTR